MSPTILAAFAAWIPASMILFRAIGPRRAAPIALLAAFLLLPRDLYPIPYVGIFTVNKRTVAGLALLAGILVSDPRALIRGRPRLLDLPMIAFVGSPLLSLAANGLVDWKASIDQVFRNFAEWSLPYLVGRLYFGDRDGPRRLSVSLVVAGLLSIPIFAFEMIAGPRWYLAGMVYGLAPHQNMVARLGGWRPEGFQSNGIEAATWMALTATVAAWIWLRRAWTPPKLAAWAPALALTVVTVACRGVFGYANLGIGMVAAGLTHLLRTRAILIVLAMVPPAYLVSRISGAWDGQGLVRVAAMAGRPDTIVYRLRAEEAYLKKVMDHGIVFGFGGTDSGIFDYWSQSHLWPDGWWVHQLRPGGVVGLSMFFLAMFLIPAGLGLALPTDRIGGASPGAMAWGLSLFLILHALDSLQNMDPLMPTPLIGGSLVGLFLARRSSRVDVDDRGSAATPPPGKRTITPFLVTAAILILVEILGRWPRPSAPPFPGPSPTPRERHQAGPPGEKAP